MPDGARTGPARFFYILGMYDTGWKDTYDYKYWAGRASGFGWADGSGGMNVNTFDPIGYGRARREYGRHSFGKSEGYGFGYGTNEGSGEESNTGDGMGSCC